MITPSFSLTATERVLPRMALDFTTASLDNRVTFTRTGNTATVVNSSGLIAPINADLPRFDYNPNTLVCKGLLIEEARTNNITYSSDLSNVSWGKFGGATVTTDTTVSPDGTQNADTVSISGSKYIEKVVAAAAGTYCFSTFFKLTGSGTANLQLTCAGSGSTNTALVINLTTGAVTIGFGTPVAFGSEVFGSWVRVYSVGTHVSGSIACYYIAYGGAVSVPIWGAQLEAGAFPTSYIPTVATSVTRNADVATMTGTNFSSWFNASEGAFALQASSTNTSTTNAALFACHNTAANMIDMYNQSDSQLIGRVRSNNANTAIMPNGTVVDGATETYAIAYKTANMAVSNKGAAPTTNTTAYTFTSDPNTLAIGANQIGTQQINGYMRKLMFYPQRIINAEVQAFSK